MVAFRYEAYDAAGRLHKGVLEADTARQLRARLRERGWLAAEVASVSDASMGHGGSRWHWRRGLSGTQLCLVTRQFATLLAAGLPVEQTLNALIEQADTDYQRQVLAGVRAEVLAGHSLARALQKYPRVFPELYATLVAAGEQSGRLGEVMERLADYTESHQALRQKVGLAFVYPAIVTLVAGTVVLGLLTYVVPQVVNVFQNTQQTLPWLTRALIGVSDFLRASWWLWLAATGAAVWAARRALARPQPRLRFHRWLLRLPLAGALVRGVNSAQLASTLAILVGSGVPLLAALQAGAGVVNNLPMRQAVEEAARKVREGGSLSRALAAAKLFPPMLVHMIASGEASGRLAHMLERAAAQQSQEMENRVMGLTSLLEPLLIVAMGAVVLVIVLAILLPIFEMNQLVH
ncbi:type II secretion system inner membrane protein GspF [Thiobacillus sp. 65-1402]|uniref:type II secretion system inner membrane protein GspF n=1 Tax=Thiobacillus sp. 65-1402 TaxID=1895861 RepID=UPI000962DEDA|nr:type II secretion system inner membrane protein GspF [Thiobacillus sp. 65-1402]OJW83147.1 MAG: type II secretion system protein GspF [Thiobacillus sp. 65-1402]